MVNLVNTMGSSFLLEEGRFPSFDEKVCSVICEGLCEDLEAYLVKGLDPNHILNSDVLVQGKLFLKGTPIIFLVLHCCTITHGYGEPFGMISLLLERGVDLEKRFLHGGGYTSVLEHACENADNLLEEILVRLLRAASPQASHAALDKISNPEKKERIKKQVFPNFLSHQELEALSSTSLPMLGSLEVEEFFSTYFETTNFDEKDIFHFNEEDICQCLVEGCEEKLCSFLDEGLSPDYIFTQDVLIEGFVCLQGSSLLLCTLQACIQKNSSNVLYNIVALLLERGVDLEKECLGIDPLGYLCENEDCFPKELILCLLTSVSSRKAFAVLAKVPDSDRRQHLEEVLRSNLSCFQFDPDLEREQEVLEQNMLVQVQEPLSSSLSEIPINTTAAVIIDLEELVSCIYSSNLELLEEILKNPFLLEEYNKEVQSKSPEDTLFSFLIFQVKDVYIRHKLCLLFLKYGHTPETIVKGNMTMASLLCSLRRKVLFNEDDSLQGILLETLCAVFFFFEEGTSINYVLKNLMYNQDRIFLSSFFIDKTTGAFSKQSINFIDLMTRRENDNHDFCDLFRGFLAASMTVNRNAITKEEWSVNCIIPFLDLVRNRLRSLLKENCQRKRKSFLLEILESLLKAIIHSTGFNEEKISLCKFTFQMEVFKNPEIQKEVFGLINKYLGGFFENNNTTHNASQRSLSKTQTSMEEIYLEDWGSLEEILKNASLWEECNRKVQSKNPKETLFSVLISQVRDVYMRHRICLLFLKYGHTPETIVKGNMTMASLLCSLRRRISINENSNLQGVLLETLCAVFFFFKEGNLVEDVLENLIYNQDRTFLSSFFIDKTTGTFSKQSIDFINLMKMDRNLPYKPLLQGFIDASLIANKNIITGDSWNVNYLLLLLKKTKDKLCNFCKKQCKERERRQQGLLEILEFLLKATIHENSYNEDSRKNYNFWCSREVFDFKDFGVKVEVLRLIQRYWGDVLDQTNQAFLFQNIEFLHENQSMSEQIMMSSQKRKNQEEDSVSKKNLKRV